jgi:hypothetical protein
MKYKDLLEKVDKFEEEIELTECIYFGAIEKLGDVQKELSKLGNVQHIRRVIKPFLIQWGMMGRVVGREGLDWKKLSETLRDLEKEFGEFRERKFISIDFDEEKFSSAIKKIYDKLDFIPYIGSPTAISKILHLLNPEIFVMWDNDIRKLYKNKNSRVRDTSEGYLEFLKDVQKELREALEERQREIGKGLDEVEQEIRGRYKRKTLARIVDEYNWITAHPDFILNDIFHGNP